MVLGQEVRKEDSGNMGEAIDILPNRRRCDSP